jgi:hypothetical protein
MLPASTIGGYVLEEVLAKLLADNGYELLTSDIQDPVHLLKDKHGLLVRGRGANHQADALGDLLVPVPFSLPLRLFAEAKNRAGKTGLDVVRNAMGVVSDVNEFQPPPAGLKLWRGDSTYHYRYSLFSTSGFTQPAQDFALAHQISLIDLSGPSFASLRQAVGIFASAAQALAARGGLETFPVGQMRAVLRVALGTFAGPVDQADPSTGELPSIPWPELRAFAQDLAASIDDDLVLGFPAGPQVLALRPDDAQAFREWAEGTSGIIPMRLRYAPGRPHGEWILLPATEPKGGRLVLRFGTPPALAEWLFAPEGKTRRRLDKVKRGLLSTITIYQGGRRVVLQLDLDWSSRSDSREVVLSQLQEELLDRDLAWEPDEEAIGGASRTWTHEAAGNYVDLLRQRDPSRLKVLLHAAANGDWISRAHIYELMDFDPQRKMTGFTKPFETIRKTLVVEGLLRASVSNPVVPRYPERGGWALGLDLDPELGRTLRMQLPLLLEPENPER